MTCHLLAFHHMIYNLVVLYHMTHHLTYHLVVFVSHDLPLDSIMSHDLPFVQKQL